ncbi:MAG: DUF4874 domain-containing protein [Clostridiales bacterium]|nr:DUF4874 domain-containing protein [Clostridiales bacterium]
MKRKALKLISFFAVIIGAVFMIYGYFESARLPDVFIDGYPQLNIDSSFEVADLSADASVTLTDYSNSEFLLGNPDRGLRLETYITLGNPLTTYPLRTQDPFLAAANEIAKYAQDKPTLAQTYIYLSNYSKSALDAQAFAQMKRYFELFRDNGIRMLVRFAYATENVPDARFYYVNKHLTQIGKWFKENAKLIDDTVYCVQAGIVGYWGEGHSNYNFNGAYIGRAYALLADIVPPNIYVQVRTDELYYKLPEKYRFRIGMHQDYIIGDPTDEWCFYTSGSAENRQKLQEVFKYTVNDGEMPWGTAFFKDVDGDAPLNNIDGKKVIKEITEYNLTSLSLTHNYRESDLRAPYSMERWKTEYVDTDILKSIGAPYNQRLFKDAYGSDIAMSIYDYIRYHLGYQLALSNAAVVDGNLTFTVSNYGMAAPLNFNNLALVVNSGGTEKEYRIASYDKTLLQPMTTVKISVKLPSDIAPSSKIGVRLSTKGGSGISLRFANGTQFENGVQYFMTL